VETDPLPVLSLPQSQNYESGVTLQCARRAFGVAPSDPMTFAAVCVTLLVVAIAACLLPARPAIRVDSSLALRGNSVARRPVGTTREPRRLGSGKFHAFIRRMLVAHAAAAHRGVNSRLR
jgi:hypothetical protein